MAPRKKFNAHVKRLVAARGEWKCYLCGELLDEGFECDHKIALADGGEDTIDALYAAHAACHKRKTIREEVARLARYRESRHAARPPLTCTRCERVVSPYFLHTCPTRPY